MPPPYSTASNVNSLSKVNVFDALHAMFSKFENKLVAKTLLGYSPKLQFVDARISATNENYFLSMSAYVNKTKIK